jgi:tetraacyldisaccharide 4'-kinase
MKIWYTNHPSRFALAPLSWLFCAIVRVRRFAYKYSLLKSYHPPVPVIIVGNLTVGGTGKTPLVIWLGQFLLKEGFKPGIVSRGYGGRAQNWPQPVYPDSDPQFVGDEAILLARQSGCPVAVAPRRIKAVQSLLDNCNIIISDDGLQHYALHRDIEIAVVDGTRRYGNQHCLPAGPLREPLSRLKEIDFIVTKSEFDMQYHTKALRRVADDNISQSLSELRDHTVHAVAGIGHPAHFFNSLRDHGLKLHCHEFPDHHHYSQSDIQFNDNLPVIMTEKDAVKCQHFAGPQHWYLPIEARLPSAFGERLLNRIQHGQKTT